VIGPNASPPSSKGNSEESRPDFSSSRGESRISCVGEADGEEGLVVGVVVIGVGLGEVDDAVNDTDGQESDSGLG
jgi:hypothetical protein